MNGVYGKLTIERLFRGGKDRRRMAACTCSCGRHRVVRLTRLTTGGIIECVMCAMGSARRAGKFGRRRFSGQEREIRDSFGGYGVNARRKGLNFQLSLDQFRQLVTSPCRYCGFSEKRNGVDRLDNSKGYLFANCVPCCSVCNYAKREMRVEQFFSWVRAVYEHIR